MTEQHGKLEYLASQVDAGTGLDDAHLDELLDAALDGTFPASDPVAIGLG